MSSETESAAKTTAPAKPRRQAGGKAKVVTKDVTDTSAELKRAAGTRADAPPTIRPKTKPRPTTGHVNVKRVGHADGEARPSHPTHSGAALTPGSHGPRRPHKVAPPTSTVAVEAVPAASAPRRPPVKPAATVVGPGGVEASGEVVKDKTKPRKAGRVKLNLSYVAPLSVMKISFLVAIALGVAFVVAVFIFWKALNDRHVFTQINDTITELVGANRPESLEILQYVTQGRVMSGAAIIAVVDVVVITLISTLFAVIYNIIAALVGGVRVTLREH
ncbi:MAG: DUF3566 domain-containing protein [Bifidobacteriaceae bacterium]|jgi:hypothetical protein|nr:DUF3566 domain-containing protein [Bifidobacteriaceae bacterium]